MTNRRILKSTEAEMLGLKVKEDQKGIKEGHARYSINKVQWDLVLQSRTDETVVNSSSSKTSANDYGKDEVFFLSAYCKETKSILSIEDYCKKYNLPYESMSSFKFLPYHYKEPSYNIVFKENVIEVEAKEWDWDAIVSKHIKPVEVQAMFYKGENPDDANMLTFTDVHVGMETDAKGNAMYAEPWTQEEAFKSADLMAAEVIMNKTSHLLNIDELGDFLDGYNAQTTRGGHALPQNMTNEEAFDCALDFKIRLIDNVVNHFKKVICNNVCNDNHAGSFGYTVNSAFKRICELKYPEIVEVNNYRQFMSHYFIGRACFIVSHGKDDESLKFGFKPQLDSKGMEKIDQYCKRFNIYGNAEIIIFKKGDSHQCLMDMATSDDFYYFNYPALSPSSTWVQNNFKKGRRGFVLEKLNGTDITQQVKFIKEL
jgi:hypothetical protein